MKATVEYRYVSKEEMALRMNTVHRIIAEHLKEKLALASSELRADAPASRQKKADPPVGTSPTGLPAVQLPKSVQRRNEVML